MNKYRLVKITASNNTVRYEIEKRFLWIFWVEYTSQWDYRNAISLIDKLNNPPMLIREVINIE